MAEGRFRVGHSEGEDWRTLAAHCLAQIGDGPGRDNFGWLYVSDHFAGQMGAIHDFFAARLGINDWIGTVGIGVCATGTEYFDQPAMAVMVTQLPRDAVRLFNTARQGLDSFVAAEGDWLERAGTLFGMVHGIICKLPKVNDIAIGIALMLFGTGLAFFLGKAYIQPQAPHLPSIPLGGWSDIPQVQVALQVNPLFLAGIVLAFAMYWAFKNTRWGLIVRMTGDSAPAALALGVYGESKAAGEEILRATLERHLILRTSWVFSANGANFVKTMLKIGAEREELGVVDDQHGCPTSARSIASVLLQIADRYLADRKIDWGTYHYCNRPETTWFGFAKEIFRRASGYDRLRLEAIASSEYPTPAQRPENSVLDCSKIEAEFGIERVSWADELEAVLNRLAGE